MRSINRYILPASVFIFVIFLLGMMEFQMDESMMAIDRFLPGYGWIQICLLAIYGSVLSYKMQDAGKSAKWRQRSWLLFSIVFFSQFALGIIADERFLMSGKLHLPVPFMIAAGPIYRAQMTIMPMLLLSSIVLTGPAWCSQYCYFGAWDQVLSRSHSSRLSIKKMRVPLRGKWVLKSTTLVIIVVVAWAFRMLGFSGLQTLIPALGFALIGIMIMIFVSRKRGKMAHCVAYCPIGTVVNLGKYISPFRMKISSSCTKCQLCIPSCPYDALNLKDIEAGKPGPTCTLCGDCVSSCKDGAIQYRFLKMSPKAARNLYLFLTISIHVLCMGLARI